MELDYRFLLSGVAGLTERERPALVAMRFSELSITANNRSKGARP